MRTLTRDEKITAQKIIEKSEYISYDEFNHVMRFIAELDRTDTDISIKAMICNYIIESYECFSEDKFYVLHEFFKDTAMKRAEKICEFARKVGKL